MTGMEKFAEACKKQGIDPELAKEAVIGAALGAAARFTGKAIATPFVAGARGAAFLGRQARGAFAGFKSTLGGGTFQQGRLASRVAALPKAVASTKPINTMSAMKETAGRVSGPPVAAAAAPAAAPSPSRAGMSLQARMGQPPAAPAAAAPVKPKWNGGGALAANAILPGRKPQGAGDTSGMVQSPGGIWHQGSMFELLDKVSEVMPDATDDEKIAVAMELATEAGFGDALIGVAGEMGYVPPAQEKTASDETPEKKASVRYTKFTVQDIIGHLSDQWGRPEPIEKDASVLPGFSKLSRLVEVELGRPS